MPLAATEALTHSALDAGWSEAMPADGAAEQAPGG